MSEKNELTIVEPIDKEEIKNQIYELRISDNKGRTPLRLSEYNDYITEYPGQNISFIKSSNRTHDRYIILDYGTKTMKVYHCGASSKDAGRKITTITEIKEGEIYKDTIKTLLMNPPLVLN